MSCDEREIGAEEMRPGAMRCLRVRKPRRRTPLLTLHFISFFISFLFFALPGD